MKYRFDHRGTENTERIMTGAQRAASAVDATQRGSTNVVSVGARHVVPIIFAALFLAALPALAQDRTVTADEVNAVAGQLYCPVCEGIPLDTCGTPACIQWRGEIRAQLEEGRTPQQVIDDFVARFGERVVGTPQDPTLRALSLVTPVLLAGAALAVGAATLLRWRRQTAQAMVASANRDGFPAADDNYRARLEADVRARR